MTNLTGDLVATPNAAVPSQLASSKNTGGARRALMDRITLAGAAIADTVEMGSMPSDAVLSNMSMLHWDALGTGVTLDIGALSAPTGLASAQAAATAGSVGLLDAVSGINGKLGDELWQMLGLAADPGGEITLQLTIGGAAATGAVAWDISYTTAQ